MKHAEIGGRLIPAIGLLLLGVSLLPVASIAWAQGNLEGRPETATRGSSSVELGPEWDSAGYRAQGSGPNKSPGVIVDPTELWVREPNGTVDFNVRLATQPGSPVTILLTPSNEQCNLSRTQVELQESNWSEGIDVSITTSFGAAVDGEQICIVQTGPAVSLDPVYNGRRSDNVTVLAGDIIQAGISVGPTSLEISEPSGSAAFTITLTIQPQPTVTIPVFPLNAQCTVEPEVVLVDAQNWSSGAAVMVTAVDDGVLDGDQNCVVKTGPPSGGDPRFEGLTGDDVIVTVLDTDTPLPTEWLIYLPSISQRWPPTPGIPGLQPIDNGDGDGDYSVTWTTAPGAETYVLEEAENSAFGSAVEVYTGPATSHPLSGQATGRHHYRVKARNSWGDSAWSDPQSADVLWELEPNNQASQANGALISGLTYRGRFPSRADEYDYYFFDLAATGPVELWLRDVPAGQDYNLVLRDATQNVVGYSAWRGSANEYISETLSPGRYYAQVWNYAGDGSTLPYHLQVIHQ